MHGPEGGHLDRIGIAARLRGLIGGQLSGDIGAVARKLAVDEVSLRMSIDPLAPYPTLDVLSAVVVVYGVDPTWLITGDYDSGTHRSVAESEPERAHSHMRDLLRAFQQTNVSSPTDPPTLRLMKDA